VDTFFEAYLDRLQELHEDIEKALEGLPQAGLDWLPGKEMNSIAVLVVHLAGAERYWIGDVLGGDPSNRNRDMEFQVHGLSGQDLKDRLSDSLAYIRNQVSALNLQDLAAQRTSQRYREGEVSVAWSLLHVLEHTALHLGHIQVARQLWHQRQIA
jgi:uncharacterized damage-inducible protein DinB